ncbi:MAG: hypothetical protein HZB44_03475 [Actinobacteria bacterium]|nr:hypothetical protein [Actinomycetota bacterium]
MTEFEEKEFNAVKGWYEEWSRIPKYIVTASLALLAFSLTNFVLKKGGVPTSISFVWLKVSWIFFFISASFASLGMFTAYCSFDIGVRIHLRELITSLHMNTASRDTKWVTRFGRTSWRITVASMIFLLLGSFALAVFTFKAVDAINA